MWKVMGDYIMQSSKELGVVVLDNKVFNSGVMMGQLKRRRGVVGGGGGVSHVLSSSLNTKKKWSNPQTFQTLIQVGDMRQENSWF
jgi:hypothetical protein